LNYAFERVFVNNIYYIDISESSHEVIHKFGFFFTILYDGASFILNKLFFNYDVDGEESMI